MASRTGRMMEAFERMSERERRLVMLLATLVFLLVVVVGALLVRKKTKAVEDEISEGRDKLMQVQREAPTYLKRKKEAEEADKQFQRATKDSLQATLLAIGKKVMFEMPDESGLLMRQDKLSDHMKFGNEVETLAENAARKASGAKKAKVKGLSGKDVYEATLEVELDKVPDKAVYEFLEKIESSTEPLFGVSLDIRRESTTFAQVRATVTVAQFRYARGETASGEP